MASDKLYDLAIQYKKTRLWKKLKDTELFAFTTTDGEIAYCSVMGELGEHIALALYVGEEGLDSYRKLHDGNTAMKQLEAQEILLSQDCLQCSYENKEELAPWELVEAENYGRTHGIIYRGNNAFPLFKRFKPSKYPWFIKSEVEERHLCEALAAAIYIAERLKTEDKQSLGFKSGAPYNRSVPFLDKRTGRLKLCALDLPAKQESSYPSPLLRNELLAAKLKKQKRSGAVWLSAVVMSPNPVSHEDEDENLADIPENAPVFPYMLLTVDNGSHMILSGQFVKDYTKEAEVLLNSLAEAMQERGAPSVLRVQDRRTECLLSRFTKQIGVTLEYHESLPLLDDLMEDFFEEFSENGSEEEEFEDFLTILMTMDDKALRGIPQELKEQLRAINQQGVFPEEVSDRIRRVLK